MQCRYENFKGFSNGCQVNCITWHDGAKRSAVVNHMATQDVERFVDRWGFYIVFCHRLSNADNIWIHVSVTPQNKDHVPNVPVSEQYILNGRACCFVNFDIRNVMARYVGVQNGIRGDVCIRISEIDVCYKEKSYEYCQQH